jgi:hypothetical protein
MVEGTGLENDKKKTPKRREYEKSRFILCVRRGVSFVVVHGSGERYREEMRWRQRHHRLHGHCDHSRFADIAVTVNKSEIL